MWLDKKTARPRLFGIVIFILVSFAAAQRHAGDDCNTENGSAGVCKLISECQAAKEELQKGNRPVICSFQQGLPVVCCPAPRPPPTTAPVTTPARPDPVPSSSKSKQKCEEYSSLVYVRDAVTVLIPNYVPQKESQCIDGKPYVIGGTEAEGKEFPHMASLGYGDKNNITWACGGSLISDRFILTAAHCLKTQDWGLPKWVRLGDLNLKRNDDDAQPQQFDVADVFSHPGHNVASHYNDIALLKLDRKVKFDGYVRPACLHVEQNIPTEKPEAIGWGRTDWIGRKGSDHLLKVRLEFVAPEICNDTFAPDIGSRRLRNGITPDSMLCVGDLNGGHDTCQGDSGGPLHIRLKQPYCMFDILGITSFGSICGSANSPAVYTRVSNYIPWIENIVWG